MLKVKLEMARLKPKSTTIWRNNSDGLYVYQKMCDSKEIVLEIITH